jgi:capsular polysaccharide transport system ATP-binding protein
MIVLDQVSKTYRTRRLIKHVLRDVQLSVSPGEALAILGGNGVGKSTLLRLIAGVEQPSSGRVDRGGQLISWPIGYTSCFQSSLTGADNARFIARIYRRPVQDMLKAVEDFAQLGLYMQQPLRVYFAGMVARLAFAVSLAIDFDCYLVDEVTAAGDERFGAKCHAALLERRDRATLCMVSHDVDTLRAYCTRGAVLDRGRLHLFDDLESAIREHQRAASID